MTALAKDLRTSSRRRPGPRRDPGFINNRLEVDPGADAACLQHCREAEHGGEAAATGGRARRSRRLRRRRVDRRQDPGRYWINLRTTDLHSKYSLADLTFHESIPGHIWQGEYTHQLPLIRSSSPSTRIRRAGRSMRSSSPTSSAPTMRIRRASRLPAVDRLPRVPAGRRHGIHAKRWTREQGVRFFVDVNGSNPLEVASEVDRYCAWPGQACGYKVGHSEINRQREKAKAALGPEVRSQGVRRRGGARRQRAARRAREKRRRIYRAGEAPSSAFAGFAASTGSRRESGLRGRAAAPTHREHRVVEAALVELRPELRLGFGAHRRSSARPACRTSACPGQLM